MQFLIRVIIIVIFLYGKVRTKETPTTEETDAIVGLRDDLTDSTLHPKLGDLPILNRKILKGHRVTIREHPYVVSIRRLVSHYVSGAILSKNLFVTVAHPLFKVPITELGVVLGENYSDRGSTMYTVVLTIFHKNFNPYTMQNDIALLRTYEEISFRGAMKPIKLFSPQLSLNGHRGFVTGWGRCDTSGTEICLGRSSRYFPNERLDPMLRSISFDIVHPNPRCLDYKRYDIMIYPGMLCLGQSREDDQACPCLGSPGALLVAGTELAGIQSWGFGCGYLYDLPLIYTDINYYIPWLLENIILLKTINQRNITGLFQATKAAILSEWIIKTRVITPKPEIRSEKSMERLDLDVILVRLNGTVYDIRDYISNGSYQLEKVAMYNSLIENEVTKSTNPITTTTTITTKSILDDEMEDGNSSENTPADEIEMPIAKLTNYVPPFSTDSLDSDLEEDTVSENIVEF